MSLAQHVSSIEGSDRLLAEDEPALLGSSAGFGSIRRVLSYNAFPSTSEVQLQQSQNVTAYKVSETQRAGKFVLKRI